MPLRVASVPTTVGYIDGGKFAKVQTLLPRSIRPVPFAMAQSYGDNNMSSFASVSSCATSSTCSFASDATGASFASFCSVESSTDTLYSSDSGSDSGSSVATVEEDFSAGPDRFESDFDELCRSGDLDAGRVVGFYDYNAENVSPGKFSSGGSFCQGQ